MFFDWLFGDFLKGDVNNVIDGILSPESRKELFGVDSKSVISSYHVTGDSIDITYTVNDEDVDKSKKSEELLEKWESLTSFYDNIKITIKFNDKDVFEYIWDDKQKCFIEKIYTVPEYKEALGNSICPPGDGDGNSNKKDDEKVEAVIKKGLNELNEKIWKKGCNKKCSDADIKENENTEKYTLAERLKNKINSKDQNNKMEDIFIPESAADIFNDYIIEGEHYGIVESGDKHVGIYFSVLDLIENNDDKEENDLNLFNIARFERDNLLKFCEILQKKFGFSNVIFDYFDGYKHIESINFYFWPTKVKITDIKFTAFF